MSKALLWFSLACLSGLMWPTTLNANILAAFSMAVIPLLLLSRLKCAFFLLGILWFHLHAQSWLEFQPHWYAPHQAVFTGEIIKVQSFSDEKYQIDIAGSRSFKLLGHRPILRLYWKTKEVLTRGQIWNIVYRPKPLSASLNLGQRNPLKQFAADRVVLKGKVLHGQLQSESHSWRWKFLESIEKTLMDYQQAPFMLALMTGQRNLFKPETWRMVRDTGLGHLFAISGLHLAIIMFSVRFFIAKILARLAPSEGLRNHGLSLFLGMACTVFFAWFSGFSVSSQRALCMLLCVITYHFFHCASTVTQRLNVALFSILLFDPLTPLTSSFWLSFIALALILALMQKIQLIKVHRWFQAVILQWVLSCFMGIVQICFFSGVTLHSLWMNVIWVPIFSSFLIPFSFVCVLALVFFPDQHSFYLGLLNRLLGWVSAILEPVSLWPGHFIYISQETLIHSACLIFMVVIFFCMRGGCRVLLLVTCAGYGAHSMYSYAYGWWVHVLDVGQGLALVVERRHHAVIYDTGAAFSSGYSYAENILIPFLHERNITHVDRVVVSHADNDHAGGVRVLMQHFPEALLVANPHPNKKTAAALSLIDKDMPCLPMRWRWMHLEFEVIWPLTNDSSNDASCVLRVEDADHSFLFTGDISSKTEHKLVDLGLKPVDFLQVPHHGSRTSSSLDFLEALQPEAAFSSASLFNIYGFPHSQTRKHYQSLKIPFLQTAHAGQISFFLLDGKHKILRYRYDQAFLWFNQLHKFGKNQIKG